ncbi:hypothetical protein HY214_00435 [Candidatus Roizmanbacteria bacterium]|nr:hypothetical protein [Candidatus Roizmanbacteria bacterium]
MQRKTRNKRRTRQRPLSRNQFSLHYLVIILPLILLFLSVLANYKSSAESKVLGTTTGPIFLAKGGDDGGSGKGGDDHRDSGGSSNNSGNSGSSNAGSPAGGGPGGGGSSSNTTSNNSGSSSGNGSSVDNTGAGNSAAPVPDNKRVLCTGPDGKQFQADFKHCSELNSAWSHPVTFTVLNQPASDTTEQQKANTINQENEIKKEKVEKSISGMKIEDKLEVKTENKLRVDIGKTGTKIRIKLEGDKAIIKAKQGDKNEVELDEHDALEKVNEALKKSEVELHKTGDTIALKNGEVEAETHLPLSVDPQTNELTVETETGVKKVTVLPKQAVQNLLSKKIITSVQTEIAKNPQTAREQAQQKTELTQVNGEAVFKIQGVANKRLLGIFNVALPKTILTSAETGEIRKIDESFMSRIFDAISF